MVSDHLHFGPKTGLAWKNQIVYKKQSSSIINVEELKRIKQLYTYNEL